MIEKPMLAMTCSGGSITPYGRSASTRSCGTNTSVEHDVVARGAPHAEDVPVVGDHDALGGERDRHVQHAHAALGVVGT